jgi:tRNA threonylcarbamoyladenosine biosynthesis protein TsaE
VRAVERVPILDRRESGLEGRSKLEIVTHSPAETLEFGRRFASELHRPCVVLLEGNLGSGKTTLTKGLVAGLGAAPEDEVTSPSFTLVHEYGEREKVYHVDLYRVDAAQELASLGLEELFAQPAIVIIEWGEKLGDNVPVPFVRIQMEHLTGEDRKIIVEGWGV